LQSILAGIAQFDNECRADRARRAMQSVAQRGGWTCRAPYGYRIGPGAVLVEHPDEARIVRDLFAGLAQGRRTLAQTVAVGAECGLTATRCRKLLRAPVYAGLVCSRLTDGQAIQGAHAALVPMDAWQQAQEAQSGHRQGPHRPLRDEWPLRGILRCGECGRPVTACWVTGHGGRYGYYQCRAGHARGRADRVHLAFADLLVEARTACIPILTEIRQEARAILREHLDAQRDVEGEARARADRIRARRQRLLDAFLDGALAQADFAGRDAALRADLEAATAEARGETDDGIDLETAVGEVMAALDDCVSLWERCGLAERRKLAKVFFGDGLVLVRGGGVQTSPGRGLRGLICASGSTDGDMARLKLLWSNLIDAAAELRRAA
jgi:hypothetical protein